MILARPVSTPAARIVGAIAAMAALSWTAAFAGSASGASGPAAIRWEKGYDAAVRRARAEGKPVMVDFWADWCHWCHELEATTYRAPRVVELARGFVAVRVDTEGDLASAERTARLGVETLPTIAFLSPSGRPYLRRSGFEGPDRFAATMEEALRRAPEVIAHEAALARDGKDPEALAGLGSLLFEQGLEAEARTLLRRARTRDGARPVLERKRTRRLLALAARDDRKAARRLLEEALALEPAQPDEDASAAEALARLSAGASSRP